MLKRLQNSATSICISSWAPLSSLGHPYTCVKKYWAQWKCLSRHNHLTPPRDFHDYSKPFIYTSKKTQNTKLKRFHHFKCHVWYAQTKDEWKWVCSILFFCCSSEISSVPALKFLGFLSSTFQWTQSSPNLRIRAQVNRPSLHILTETYQRKWISCRRSHAVVPKVLMWLECAFFSSNQKNDIAALKSQHHVYLRYSGRSIRRISWYAVHLLHSIIVRVKVAHKARLVTPYIAS